MKYSMKIFWVILALVIIGVFAYYQRAKILPAYSPAITTENDSIKGCYVARLKQDVYTLHITSQQGEVIQGNVSFKNFEKDSSSGNFTGFYRNGVLLGDYYFKSEGSESRMQLSFKKEGNDFVRGYAPVNETGDRFLDLSEIIYDPGQTFILSPDECRGSF